MDIDVLFDHLLACKTNDHLIFLQLELELPIPDLVSTLIPFLQAYSKLKCLQLFIVYPANGIVFFMESWLENQPESLMKVFIDISGVEDERDYKILMNLTSEYVSRLELVRLNVEVDLNF
ncbi:hypothetical protein AVEN_157048-1 [Araneus ventricosus]|uniref:Uncharacterized protein n=1 Tax=Araneus ventricosus TaxID=182803 RepID=A0A4Y2RMY8_ARAVE|nr:hypothetical protein AVEN_157048-1 [Araneus ventricosus]